MGAENGGVHRPVGGLGAVAEGQLEPVGQRVRGEHVVPTSDERLDEEEPGEAAADHKHPSSGNALDRAQDTGERFGEGAGRVVDLVGKGNRLGRERALGEAARDDRGGGEPFAGRLVPRPAARALAARQVVDERDAAPLDVLGDDLVAEDRARRGAAELLHVGAAEAACSDADERSGALRLGNLGERRLPGAVQDDGAHDGTRK